jgi:NlpC/P60 family
MSKTSFDYLSLVCYATAMFKFSRPAPRWLRTTLVCLLGAVVSTAALAAPQPDDMDQFLQEKGLIGKLGQQIGQVSGSVASKASELVVTAMGYLGVPYQRGGNNFDQGFDCSGFVRAIYQQTAGMLLPRRSAEQAAATQPIDKSELQPGDLVFFNTLKASFSHVGIYVGDNKFIHSPRSGAVVRVEDMRIGYWNSRFNGARRVPQEQAAP